MEPWLSERQQSEVRRRPDVSVIVPARNEEASLGACLESLLAQQGIGFEVIVVDDDSSDRTAQIARSFPSVRVISADPLPAGCSGKCNALNTGVKHAVGEWLLFTDADTVHLPGSLARALAEAKRCGAALLSYSPAQQLHGIIERAVMPVIFAELACEYRPRDICDPKSPAAAANGQYLLISREAYDAAGGHAAVAACILEDVELARAVKRSGQRIRFRFGGDAVRARMYRSFRQLSEGWTKNLTMLFKAPVLLALTRLLEFVAIVCGLALFALATTLHDTHVAVLVGISVVLIYAAFLLRLRKAHAGAGSAVLGVFGLPIFSYLLLRSVLYYKWHRSVTWKGRHYSTAAESTAQPANPNRGQSPRPAGERWST